MPAPVPLIAPLQVGVLPPVTSRVAPAATARVALDEAPLLARVRVPVWNVEGPPKVIESDGDHGIARAGGLLEETKVVEPDRAAAIERGDARVGGQRIGGLGQVFKLGTGPLVKKEIAQEPEWSNRPELTS